MTPSPSLLEPMCSLPFPRPQALSWAGAYLGMLIAILVADGDVENGASPAHGDEGRCSLWLVPLSGVKDEFWS